MAARPQPSRQADDRRRGGVRGLGRGQGADPSRRHGPRCRRPRARPRRVRHVRAAPRRRGGRRPSPRRGRVARLPRPPLAAALAPARRWYRHRADAGLLQRVPRVVRHRARQLALHRALDGEAVGSCRRGAATARAIARSGRQAQPDPLRRSVLPAGRGSLQETARAGAGVPRRARAGPRRQLGARAGRRLQQGPSPLRRRRARGRDRPARVVPRERTRRGPRRALRGRVGVLARRRSRRRPRRPSRPAGALRHLHGGGDVGGRGARRLRGGRSRRPRDRGRVRAYLLHPRRPRACNDLAAAHPGGAVPLFPGGARLCGAVRVRRVRGPHQRRGPPRRGGD